MKETFRITRVDDPNGSVIIQLVTQYGEVYNVATYPTMQDFLTADPELVRHNPEVLGKLAVLAYLAVDPTGTQPELLTEVIHEVDPTALTVFRRVAIP